MPAAHDDPDVESELARRIVAGDRAAEGELCRRLLPRIRAWGLKHTRDEAVALDLGQQVLIVVLEALRAGRVEEVDRVGAFVFGTCKRTLRGWRHTDRRRATLLETFGPGLAGVAEMRETAMDRRRLATCFDRLAPRARALLALAFFGECSGDEIAGQLHTTVGNVRVLRHRALEQLYACMESAS
jgi:RNA polymerase sigma-70 factor (ECF subfamily)